MTSSWVSRGRISNWFANIVVLFLSVTHLILVEHTSYSGRAQASIPSGRPDKEFLEVKEAQTNMQHKSIIGALRAAAPTWQFQQIYLVVRKCQSVVLRKSLLRQAQKAWGTRRKERQTLRRSCDTSMQSTRLCDSAFPIAGAKNCKANHKGIEGEHWARVRRCKEKHTLTERQGWGHRTIVDSG